MVRFTSVGGFFGVLTWGIEGYLGRSRKNAKDMCRNLDLETFKTIDVRHRTKAFGVYFKHKNDWSIAYALGSTSEVESTSQISFRFSGDTMPTQNLVRAASGATLLIHEASMGDDQEELARTKAHSTVGQAIQIARECVSTFSDLNAKKFNAAHRIQHER